MFCRLSTIKSLEFRGNGWIILDKCFGGAVALVCCTDLCGCTAYGGFGPLYVCCIMGMILVSLLISDICWYFIQGELINIVWVFS